LTLTDERRKLSDVSPENAFVQKITRTGSIRMSISVEVSVTFTVQIPISVKLSISFAFRLLALVRLEPVFSSKQKKNRLY
jgi:hypothetical protein